MVLKYRPEHVPLCFSAVLSVPAVCRIQCRCLAGCSDPFTLGSLLAPDIALNNTLNSRPLKLMTCPRMQMSLHKLLPLPGAPFSSPFWSAWHASSFVLQDCFNSAFSVRPSVATQLVFLCLWVPQKLFHILLQYTFSFFCSTMDF